MPPRRQQGLPRATDAGTEQDAGETLSVEHPEGFVQVPDSLLLDPQASDGCIRLYSVLKHHARKSSKSYPGRPRLARLMGVKSVRTVDARINELIALGFLVKTARYRPGGGQSANHYHLLFYPRPPVGAQLPQTSALADIDGSVGGFPQVSGRDSAGGSTGANSTASAQDVGGSACSEGHPLDGEQLVAPCSEMPGVDAADCEGSVHSTAGERSRSFLSHNPLPSPTGVAGSERSGVGEGVENLDASHLWAQAVVEQLPEQLYPRSRAEFQAALKALGEANASVRSLEPRVLVEKLIALRTLPAVVTSPVGLLRNRLDDLWVQPPAAAWPQWCGHCDEQSRQRWDDTTDVLARCPDCHPRRLKKPENTSQTSGELARDHAQTLVPGGSDNLPNGPRDSALRNGRSTRPGTSGAETPASAATPASPAAAAASRDDTERRAAIAAARTAIIESRGAPR